MKKYILFVLFLLLFLCSCNKEYYFNIEENDLKVYKDNMLALNYDTNYSKLTWSSSDESVATVKNGVVYGIGEGITYISVSYRKEIIKEVIVTVEKKPYTAIYHTLIIDGDPYQVRDETILKHNIFEYFNGMYHIDYDDSVFVGWYLDKNYHCQADLDAEITEDISIYSKYRSLEITSDLRIYVDNVIGYEGKFQAGLDVQTFSPAFGTYVNGNGDNLEDYALIVVEYDISKEGYFVTNVINTGDKNIVIPYNGFVICVKKKIDDVNIYLKTLEIGKEISLGKYSINTSNILYVNEVRGEFDDTFSLTERLSAEYVSVYDVRDKQSIYSSLGDSKAYIASITKVITALTALKYAHLEDKITIGDEIDICYEGSSPSTAGLIHGQIWTLRQLLYAMLLPSGNDAAYAVAALTIDSLNPNNEFTSKDKIEMFIDLMNDVAVEVGATNSHFAVPDGNSYYEGGALSNRALNNYSTANDLVKIARYAFACGALAEVCASTNISFKLESSQNISLGTTNSLLKRTTEYYCYGAVGLKTGTTTPAGYCIVSAVEINRRLVICVILKSTSSTGRYLDSLNVYKAIFGNLIYD